MTCLLQYICVGFLLCGAACAKDFYNKITKTSQYVKVKHLDRRLHSIEKTVGLLAETLQRVSEAMESNNVRCVNSMREIGNQLEQMEVVLNVLDVRARENGNVLARNAENFAKIPQMASILNKLQIFRLMMRMQDSS